MSTQPVAGGQELLPALWFLRTAIKVMVAQSPLRDGDRVILQTNFSVVVQHGNTGSVVDPVVVRFLGKQHVVFAEFGHGRRGIELRRVVPKSQLAFARQQVGVKDSPVVVQAVYE